VALLERRFARRFCSVASLAFVAACGGGGGGDGDEGILCPSNNPVPTISSFPTTAATVGQEYRYTADIKYSCLFFFIPGICGAPIEAVQLPPGAQVASRTVLWTPSASNGNTKVSFTIQTPADLCGKRATQSWTVTVTPVSTIQSFVASSLFVLPGETVTVTGVFEGTGFIDGLGAVASGVPVTIGPINAERNVTLIVQSPFGDAWTSSLTIGLLTPPTITTFRAEPATIGFGASTTLSWWIDGQLDTARIDPLGRTGLASNSALTAGPLSTTTSYVLTATNRAGSTTATVEVVVLPPSSIQEFSVSAPSTTVGGAVTLTARFNGSGELLKENDRGGMDMFATIGSGGSVSSGPLYRNTRFTLRVSGGTTITQDLFVTLTGPGTFEAVPQAPVAVQDAVVLGDGRILMTSQERAYFYDPPTRQFSAGGALTQFPVRYLTLLPDGRVMMVSPFVQTGCSLAQIYSPANNSSVNAGNLGCLPGIPVQAITLGDGRVLVRSDPRFAGDLPGITLFDGTMFGPLIPRATLAGTRGTLLADGRVLFIRTNASEIFTPGPDSFSSSNATFAARGTGDARVRLPDGRLFIAGGQVTSSQRTELYDPGMDTVSLRDAQNMANLQGQGAALLATGKVLLAGGSGYALSLLFDPATGSFSQTGGLGTPRQFAIARRLPDGRVLVLGGCGFTPCNAEIYTPP
jgi:hypothetical protein